MTAKVINDPSALGWEYDPDTDRWSWGGGSSSGGGGSTFPEAPVNGKQYGRQDAGWTEIVHSGDGGGSGTVTTADVKLTNPTLRSPVGLDTQEDANQYFVGELGKLIDEDGNVIGGGGGGIPDAPADSAIYGRKNNDWVVVPTSGGGDGPDMSLYYTAAQCENKFQPKGNYDNYSGWNIKASNGTAKKITKNATVDFVGSGNTTVTRNDSVITISSTGLTSFTETDPVFKASPAGSITQSDINKWNNSSSGGNDYDGSDAVKLTGNQSISGVKTFTDSTNGVAYYFSSTGTVGVKSKNRVAFSSDGKTTVYAGDSNANYIQVTPNLVATGKSFTVNENLTVKGTTSLTGNLSCSGTITGTDCIATSDERLKQNVTPAKAGVITQLQGVEFDWKDSEVKASGFIAQEVEKVPELQHLVHDISKEGHKGVSYIGMIPYLLEEIKALKAEIEELKK